MIDLAQHAIDAGVWLIAFEEISESPRKMLMSAAVTAGRAAPSGATVDHDAAKLTELGQAQKSQIWCASCMENSPSGSSLCTGKIDIKEGQSKDAQAVKDCGTRARSTDWS